MLTRDLLAEANFVNPETIDAHIKTMRHMMRTARLNRQGVNTNNPQGEVLNYLARGATPWDDWAARRFRQIVNTDPQYWKQVKPSTVRLWAQTGTRQVNGKPVPLPDWLHAAARRGDDLYHILTSTELQALRSRIAHVTDWFDALQTVIDTPEEPAGVRREAERLLDKRDRYTLDVAEQKANQWFAERQQTYHVSIEETGTQEVMKFHDGYRWVRITDPRALDREGSIMQHCVGGGGYDRGIEDDTIRIYSLRDPQNLPHITVEMMHDAIEAPDVWVVNQAKGKQNEQPAPKYQGYLKPLLQALMPVVIKTSDLDGIEVGDIPRRDRFWF
jgi:hypothetical protein